MQAGTTAMMMARQNTAASGPTGALPTAILALSPLSYWTLRGNDANTLKDFGSLAHDLTNPGGTPVALNSFAGSDGYSYPDASGTTAGLDGADDIAYEPANASGLTVFFMYGVIGTANSSLNVINKSDSSGAGSWRCLINPGAASGGGIDTISTTNVATNARRRQVVSGAGALSSGWAPVVLRYGSSTEHPGSRVDGVNQGGTTSGSGTINTNSSQIIHLFYHGASTNNADCSLAHVAIIAGQLSDGQCATLEAAAASDGW